MMLGFRWGYIAGGVGITMALIVVVSAPRFVEYALGAVVMMVLAGAVYRLPVLSLSILVILAVGPNLLIMTTDNLSIDVNVILGKLSLSDALLVFMMLAVVLKAWFSLVRMRSRPRGSLLAIVLILTLFFGWIAVEVLRNTGAYGIHTIGQFRYSFLILGAPIYAAIFLRSPKQRRQFCTFLLVFSVGVTLAAVPVIGYMKGWSFGPSSRFFPANVSLGLAYGWTAMLFTSERGLLKIPKWLPRGLAVPVAAMLVMDGHRSVWLAELILVVYLLAAARIPTAIRVRIVASSAAVAGVLFAAAGIFGFSLWTYLVGRASAIVDPTADPTSSWRLKLWEASLARWWERPLAGEGFGAYYQGNVAIGVAETTTPHSLYVQTLVPMGAIGLVLLVALIAAATISLRRALKWPCRTGRVSLDEGLVILGLGALISALAYWSAYSLDLYSVIWVGLGMAAVLGSRCHSGYLAAAGKSRKQKAQT